LLAGIWWSKGSLKIAQTFYGWALGPKRHLFLIEEPPKKG
jgi:hypothetical protein